jgi:hypothetical protein
VREYSFERKIDLDVAADEIKPTTLRKSDGKRPLAKVLQRVR